MVIWSEPAKADLRHIFAYIAHDSRHYAKKVTQEIVESPKPVGKFAASRQPNIVGAPRWRSGVHDHFMMGNRAPGCKGRMSAGHQIQQYRCALLASTSRVPLFALFARGAFRNQKQKTRTMRRVEVL